MARPLANLLSRFIPHGPLIRAAKAGLSLVSAVRQVSAELAPPLVQEFQLMQHEQRLGVSLDDSLEN
ncbi:MAG: type II secretion system F family protein, partial [Thiobacillus sp.]|nr:type II secretion system F family protein [Thiobacillus sp.]